MQLRALCSLLLNLLLVAVHPTSALNERLAVGDFLKSDPNTFEQSFEAVLGEQSYILAKPLRVFNRTVEQIKIFSNGFIVLGNQSIDMPHEYPSGTVVSNQRLTSLDGDFISVFSTVNQCSAQGRVYIRELKSDSVDSETCIGKHIGRFQQIISRSSPDDTDFQPNYIVTITWSDMGCITSLEPQRNRFSLVLLASDKHTYALFQYIDIEWTADHSTGSLPPEAGIFIHSLKNTQLPRSNLHTEPSVWNEESNMAVPGEWIFALRQNPVDIDATYQSEIRTLTEKFLEDSYSLCMGEEPVPASPAESEISNDSSTTLAEKADIPVEIVEEKKEVENCDGNKVCDCVKCEDENEVCVEEENEHSCKCKTGYHRTKTGSCAVNEVLFKSASICELPLEPGRCRARILKYGYNPNTRVCEEFNYGGCEGNANNFNTIQECEAKCLSGVLDSLVAPTASFNDGDRCTLPLDKGPCMANFLRFGYNSTSNQCEEFTYGGCQGNSNNFETVQECQQACQPRTNVSSDDWYTVCSLPLERGPCRASLTRYAFYDGACRAFKYGGCQGNANNFERLDECETFCRLKNDVCSRVRCGANSHCKEGHCSCDDGYEEDSNNECRPMTRNPCDGVVCGNYARCHDGRCICESGYEGNANYACTPIITDRCDNVRCGSYAKCYAGRCECESGYEGNPYYGCNEIRRDPCDNVRCGNYARCNEGRCICESGYEGEATYGCTPIRRNPCDNVRCGNYARCYEGRCICESGYEGDATYGCTPIRRDLCENVRCGNYARCYQGRCICESGYEGDATYGCTPIRKDPCENVRCGNYARCYEGRCICESGYEGDANYACIPIRRDPCDSVRCGSYARCYDGRCMCESGYEGDPFRGCTEIRRDLCHNVRCGNYARCYNGRCQCESGFEGDPYRECTEIRRDPCDSVRCGNYARCYGGRCVCLSGYEGNATYGCTPIRRDPCDSVRCGSYARCYEGRCVCEPGYEGDATYGCTPIRIESCRCGQNTYCREGICICQHGFVGDPYRGCEYASVSRCRGVRCGVNAVCRDGQCFCEPGFYGDPRTFCDVTGSHENVVCGDRYCAKNAFCSGEQCYCEYGYVGDGVTSCLLESDGNLWP